jgi:chaperonin GroES
MLYIWYVCIPVNQGFPLGWPDFVNINLNGGNMTKIVPLSNRVLLKSIEPEDKTTSGILLPDSAKEKPQSAEVIAVGAGKIEDGKKIEMTVKVGDKVIYSKYAGDDIKIDGQEYTLIDEDKILAILN